MAIAAAMGRKHVWERCSIAEFVGVNAITNARPELHRIDEDADNGARGDVNNVVDRPASLRKAGKITGQEAKTLLAAHRSRRDTSVQAQQVSDWAPVVRAASWTNRCHVLNQRKEVGTRRRRNRNTENRRVQVRQQRIKEEAGELRIILRIGNTEQGLR